MITNKRGFIKMIVVIVITLIVLGALGFNIKDIINSDKVQINLSYVWGLLMMAWNNFLAIPAMWIWNNIVIGLFWNNLIKIMSFRS
ncbi:MAG: hypothetical protein WCC74_03240 [Minisyncoccia bacterium]